MIVSPLLARELTSAPRRARLQLARGAYLGALLLVTTTAWQLLAGTQPIAGVGAMARFGAAVFQILAPLQLVGMSLYAAITTALSVGQEKERHTLSLLLMTHLTNRQLVLGKLSASLASLAALWLAGWPFFCLLALLGGIGVDQIARTQLVTLAGLLLAGSLGTLLGFWREKSFQSLALAVVGIVLWTALAEVLQRGLIGSEPAYKWIANSSAALSPWHAVLAAAQPDYASSDAALVANGFANLTNPWQVTGWFLIASALTTCVLNGLAVWRVRAWNTTLEPGRTPTPSESSPQDVVPALPTKPRRVRTVGRNPILWRELHTWAYGRRVTFLRWSYFALAVLSFWSLLEVVESQRYPARWELALPIIPLAMLSLIIVNAQAVTSLTSERDLQALDLLLVTDVTSREFLMGKLGGVFYNTKEMILAPPLLVVWLVASARLVPGATCAYVIAGWLVLCLFAAVLGVHSGLRYARSRAAISVSLGTLLFLMLGVATTMRVMVAFAGSFSFQLQPFLAAMIGGGVGLYIAIGSRSPSPAILAAAFFCPLATFYALTSFLLGHTLAVFLAVSCAYGFNIAAMLVPAWHDLNIATTGDDGL